jgi:peptide/nickel transport system substrate-binding protein
MKEKSKARIVLLISIVLLLIVLPLVKVEAATRPEGTLTVALQTLAEEGFLPDRCSGATGPIWESVYDYLIYSDNAAKGKVIPGVAERWEYSKDYRDLTLWLRKGIQFHDGWGELTAEDVKWSIELNARPTSTNLRATMLRTIKSMEVVDRYTLVIHLKEPDPTFWLIFCTIDSVQLPVLCKKYIEKVGEEKANRQPIGSGPYRLLEHRIGDYAKFEALEKHWLVVPEFKYMILRVVSEESTRVAMLKTGEVDIAMELSSDIVPEIEKAGLRSVVTPLSSAIFCPFGGMLLPEDKRYVEGYHRKDPWKDIRVREAMNIAIDRRSIAKNLFRNNATVSSIFWALPGWDKLEPIPYSPKRAKQLLVEAGYPNGFSFKIHTTAEQPELPLLAEAVAGYWEAIGLKAEIVRGDYATWRTTVKTGKSSGYVWTNAQSNYFDWSQRFVGFELPDAGTPTWQSNETKAAIKKFLTELDPQKREALLIEVSKLYRSIYSHIPIAYTPRIHGVNKKVGEWYPGRQSHPKNLIFARHPKPLNTYRLFTP